MREAWPEWAYEAPTQDLSAFWRGGLCVETPAAPGEALLAKTLIQADGDVITWWRTDLGAEAYTRHRRAVERAVVGLLPFRRSWRLLGWLRWLGVGSELALIGLELLRDGGRDGLGELLWQAGWLPGAAFITAIGVGGRWLIRRALGRAFAA